MISEKRAVRAVIQSAIFLKERGVALAEHLQEDDPFTAPFVKDFNLAIDALENSLNELTRIES